MNIFNNILVWHEECGITYHYQVKGLVANLNEELTEYLRARSANDELMMIDALCDLCVFATVTQPFDITSDISLKNTVDVFTYVSDSIQRLYRILNTFNIDDSLEFQKFRDYCIKVTGNFTDENFENAKIEYQKIQLNRILQSLIRFCKSEIEKMGFDFTKCISETVKQVTSRTGKVDESIGKWVKDKSPEAKAREYQAKYDECKTGYYSKEKINK